MADSCQAFVDEQFDPYRYDRRSLRGSALRSASALPFKVLAPWSELAACKTLAFNPERGMQSFEYRSVRQWSKEINVTGTRGRKRKLFNSRCRGGRGHRAAAPVETCQSLPNRCPWGRLGSVLDTCTRLHRIRRRFKHFWSISLSSPRRFSMNYLAMASRALGEY